MNNVNTPIMTNEEMATIVSQAYDHVKGRVQTMKAVGGVNASDLLQITMTLIPLLQTLVDTKKAGSEKKAILIGVLLKIVNEFAKPEDKNFLITVIHTTISPTIDRLIDVAKNRIDLGKQPDNQQKKCCTIS